MSKMLRKLSFPSRSHSRSKSRENKSVDLPQWMQIYDERMAKQPQVAGCHPTLRKRTVSCGYNLKLTGVISTQKVVGPPKLPGPPPLSEAPAFKKQLMRCRTKRQARAGFRTLSETAISSYHIHVDEKDLPPAPTTPAPRLSQTPPHSQHMSMPAALRRPLPPPGCPPPPGPPGASVHRRCVSAPGAAAAKSAVPRVVLKSVENCRLLRAASDGCLEAQSLAPARMCSLPAPPPPEL